LTNYVVCLKWGTKYSAEYVNKLHAMVERNLTIDHEFVCFTEDSSGISPEIRVEPLSLIKGASGWWYKPMFFDPNFLLEGTILFLDLDIIVFDNIDKLLKISPGKFFIIQDFNRCRFKGFKKFNSSIFRLETGQHSHVYTNFIEDSAKICKRFLGDQEWMYYQIETNYEYWPTEWIQSYKWEMRGNPKLGNGPRDQRDFLTPGNPKVGPGTSIAVFHGSPNPHVCKDPWVQKNWG